MEEIRSTKQYISLRLGGILVLGASPEMLMKLKTRSGLTHNIRIIIQSTICQLPKKYSTVTCLFFMYKRSCQCLSPHKVQAGDTVSVLGGKYKNGPTWFRILPANTLGTVLIVH